MKKVKKVLSVFLVMALAFGIFSISSSAEPGSADFGELDNAIATMLPDETNLYFYTDEAIDLVRDFLDHIDNYVRNLSADDQEEVDAYVDMVEGLASLINMRVNDDSRSPLHFYGNEVFESRDFPYIYPYGDDGYDFYPFRAEEKAEHTIDLSSPKAVVPLVSRVAGDQNFTLKLAIGSNSLLCAGGIPLLFDKTKLEVVGVDNNAANQVFFPTTVGDNLANYFDFMAVLNPTAPSFWPEVYRGDAAFKAKWGAINILMTSKLEDEDNYSVMPNGLEEVINIEFKVKAGAEAGFARIYIDPAFARNVAEKNNSLYFGRGKDAGSFTYYDLLATYGATLDVSADVTVEIFNVILGDTNLNGEVTAADALLTLRAVSGLVVLNEKQILQADVSLSGGAGKITSADALQIRRFVAGLIQEF